MQNHHLSLYYQSYYQQKAMSSPSPPQRPSAVPISMGMYNYPHPHYQYYPRQYPLYPQRPHQQRHNRGSMMKVNYSPEYAEKQPRRRPPTIATSDDDLPLAVLAYKKGYVSSLSTPSGSSSRSSVSSVSSGSHHSNGNTTTGSASPVSPTAPRKKKSHHNSMLGHVHASTTKIEPPTPSTSISARMGKSERQCRSSTVSFSQRISSMVNRLTPVSPNHPHAKQ